MPAINIGSRSERPSRRKKSRSTFTTKPASSFRLRVITKAKKRLPDFRRPAPVTITSWLIWWVRNIPDGRVELQVGGAESEVFAFLDSIMESELRSHIDKQTRSALAEPVKARGFDIHHE